MTLEKSTTARCCSDSAGVVNPYLAFETIAQLIDEGQLTSVSYDAAVDNYIMC